MNKLTLIINSEAQADDKKTAAYPRRRPRRLGRRRGDTYIEFYDLGQVSGDGVVYADHPLLKVPSYSVSFSPNSPGEANGTAVYDMEGFTDADYQNYTDMMFDVPLEEWHWRYKRLEYEAPLDITGDAAYTSYPSYITLQNKGGGWMAVMRPASTYPAPDTTVRYPMIDALQHSDPDTYAREMVSATGMAWWNTPVGKMKVRGLTNIASNPVINALGTAGPSYFPFSTSDKTDFKVTATNDPDAPDVGVIKPSGLTRIFMMPQIFCWAAITTSSDLLTRHVLGPVYQIMPRRYWPRFEDREWYPTEGTFSVGGFPIYDGVIDDPDGRAVDFFEYQMARGGMQASSWTRDSLSDPFVDSTFSGANSPTIWPSSNDNYVSQGFTDIISEGLFDFGGAANPYRGDTSFTVGSDSEFLSLPNPFLTAVIQKGSSFYYVWWLNMEDNNVSQQGDKFRLTLRQDGVSPLMYDDAFMFVPDL